MSSVVWWHGCFHIKDCDLLMAIGGVGGEKEEKKIENKIITWTEKHKKYKWVNEMSLN